MTSPFRVLSAVALLGLAAPATAGELFGGLYVHDVDTALTKSGIENGVDVQVGWRGGPIAGRLQPYVFGALNSAGRTHYAAAGLSMKFGDALFIRPGLGLAIHSGSAAGVDHVDHRHIDFGSRILFEPEVGVGARLTPRMTLEASWVHMSHAQLFGRQNPGIDNLGARLSLAL